MNYILHQTVRKNIKKYKVILLGSRPLASRIMQLFASEQKIQLVGIIESKAGIKKWWEGSLEEDAQKIDVPVCTIDDIDKLAPDVMFSINFTQILPVTITSKYRIINSHSLLPRFRGRNAVSWAIIHARKDNFWKFGVSLHEIDANIDTGKIIATELFDITEQDTAKTLYEKWEYTCFNLIKSKLLSLLKNDYTPITQEGKSYYYDKNSLVNKEIDLTWEPDEIYDRIRAYTFPPFERPFFMMHGQKIYCVYEPRENGNYENGK